METYLVVMCKIAHPNRNARYSKRILRKCLNLNIRTVKIVPNGLARRREVRTLEVEQEVQMHIIATIANTNSNYRF